MDTNSEITHLTSEERRIIESGVRHGSTKTAIAQTIRFMDSIPIVNLFRKAKNIFDFKHGSVIQNRFSAHASENLMLI